MSTKQLAAGGVLVNMLFAILAVQQEQPLCGLGFWLNAGGLLAATTPMRRSGFEKAMDVVAGLAITFGVLSSIFFCLFRS